MSHMVIFRTPEGKPGYQPADTVEDAIAIVERLRNDDGVENVRIFRLEEVAFEYRPYYKVELAGASSTSAEESSPAEPTPIFGQVGSGDSDDASDDYSDDGVGGAGFAEPEGSVFDAGSDEVPPPAPEQPPWAAPPPPPVVDEPAAEVGGFGDRGDSSADSDDEYSGAGQRRGLFGR